MLRRLNSPMNAEEFAQTYHVSRETLTKLVAYQALLGKWQQSVNLVGPTSLAAFWQRHAADSAQILRYAPIAKTWLDLAAAAACGAGLGDYVGRKNPQCACIW